MFCSNWGLGCPKVQGRQEHSRTRVARHSYRPGNCDNVCIRFIFKENQALTSANRESTSRATRSVARDACNGQEHSRRFTLTERVQSVSNRAISGTSSTETLPLRLLFPQDQMRKSQWPMISWACEVVYLTATLKRQQRSQLRANSDATPTP